MLQQIKYWLIWNVEACIFRQKKGQGNLGQKDAEAIRRRVIVDRELTAGRTPKEILDMYYGGEPRRELLASDLEAIRKYKERDMVVPARDDPAIVARVLRITDIIKANPKVSNEAMQRVLGISQATTTKDLQRLPQKY